MALLLDYTIHQAVERDGLPRVGDYDDGVQRMLYRDGHAIKSVTLPEWPAEQAALAARDAERAKHEAMRDGLGNAARLHVGKNVRQLTLPEIRDLFALFLEQQGMLDADGKIQSPQGDMP